MRKLLPDHNLRLETTASQDTKTAVPIKDFGQRAQDQSVTLSRKASLPISDFSLLLGFVVSLSLGFLGLNCPDVVSVCQWVRQRRTQPVQCYGQNTYATFYVPVRFFFAMHAVEMANLDRNHKNKRLVLTEVFQLLCLLIEYCVLKRCVICSLSICQKTQSYTRADEVMQRVSTLIWAQCLTTFREIYKGRKTIGWGKLKKESRKANCS